MAMASYLFVSFPIANRDFFEINDIVVAVILDAKKPDVRPPASLGFEIELSFRHRFPFTVIRHRYPIHLYDSPWTVERYIHGIPLGPGLSRFCQRLCQRIKGAGDMIVIFLRPLGMVVDLHLRSEERR